MSARDMREACAKGRDALASLWAAIGDRLCAGKPLDTAYAQRVAEECRAASRALEDVVPYGEIPMGAAPAPIATECGHESMTGLGHPRLWSCDGCGEITVEVDDQNGQSSDGTRRWRREVIGSVDVKAARKFGPPMPAAPADDAPRGEAGRSALDLVADERRHQIAKWPPAHDDEHGDGQLLAAAVELAAFHTHLVVDDGDPWGLVRKHGKDRVHSLVVAAALIVAEIERLQRSKHRGGAR